MTIFNVFTLMGGIAMFLYGMDLMGKALEQTAGSKLQGILSTMTSSPIRGLLLGMAVTAVIQSSGPTTVMAVGFVNSGLMELHQAISVIMGANVGTTVTGWLLSLSGLEGDSFLTKMMNPTAWSPILGFIGIWMYMIGKDRKRGVGKILLGFSILMAGMNGGFAVLVGVRRYPAGPDQHRRGHLLRCRAHHHGPEHRHHRHGADLLGGCKQERKAHRLRPSLF